MSVAWRVCPVDISDSCYTFHISIDLSYILLAGCQFSVLLFVYSLALPHSSVNQLGCTLNQTSNISNVNSSQQSTITKQRPREKKRKCSFISCSHPVQITINTIFSFALATSPSTKLTTDSGHGPPFPFAPLSVCLRCLFPISSLVRFPSLPFHSLPCRPSLTLITLFFFSPSCLDLKGRRRGTVINLIFLFRSGPRLFVSSIFSFSVGRRRMNGARAGLGYNSSFGPWLGSIWPS
ncbi:hypothetical protein BKA57DRAFT_4393 [Linnemannia elongata]|nr:hypothetical protein BKA57DRAFT_4393 [Linnemannia elongata]